MPFQKGHSGNPAGRPKGSQNRSTLAMRHALAQLVESNIGNIDEWLHRIAEEDPKAALQCLLSIMEFNVPKLHRRHGIENDDQISYNAEESKRKAEEILDAVLEAMMKEKAQAT